MADVQFPLINGVYYDPSSVELKIDGITIPLFKEFNYSTELEPGDVQGHKAQLAGMTRGKLKNEADMSLFKEQWDEWKRRKGAGYMVKPSRIILNYFGPTGAITADVRCEGVRIKKHATQISNGSEPIAVKIDLKAMYIMEDGIPPIEGLVQ